MDKLIELLPLPSVLLNWPHPTNHVAIRDYARACVAHATAAQAAEIEALRAEVGELHMHAKRRDQYAVEKAVQALDWKERAERLAEALREAYGQVRELCDAHVHPYPEASFARYEAALHPTAAQDGK